MCFVSSSTHGQRRAVVRVVFVLSWNIVAAIEANSGIFIPEQPLLVERRTHAVVLHTDSNESCFGSVVAADLDPWGQAHPRGVR